MPHPAEECHSRCGLMPKYWSYRANHPRIGWAEASCKYCGRWIGNIPMERLDEKVADFTD